MHTVSPTQGVANPYRPSLTKLLADRYEMAPSLPSGRPTPDGRSSSDAKRAGRPGLEAFDGIPQGNGEFRALQGEINNGASVPDPYSVQVFTWNRHGGRGFYNPARYATTGRLP